MIHLELLFFVQIKIAVQYMRHVIQKRAKFDIMDLNAVQVCFSASVSGLRKSTIILFLQGIIGKVNCTVVLSYSEFGSCD